MTEEVSMLSTIVRRAIWLSFGIPENTITDDTPLPEIDYSYQLRVRIMVLLEDYKIQTNIKLSGNSRCVRDLIEEIQSQVPVMAI